MKRLALLLIAVAAGCAGQTTTDVSAPPVVNAWTPFNDPECRHHPERVAAIDVEHYRIAVLLDDQAPGVLQGETTVTLSPLADARSVELDAEDMTFRSVTLSAGTPLAFRTKPSTVAVDLGRTVRKGEKVTFTLTYEAKPKHGLFWVVPDAGYPDRPWMVWSQGETEYNHHWFPCYDFPNDRATSEVVVTYPVKYVSVSNGELVTWESGGYRRTDHWRQGEPHPAYLISLIVGDFEVYRDAVEVGGRTIPLQYAVPRGSATEEEVRHAFGRTAEMIRFFSERTGVPYPYAKYAQTCVLEFIWGGMENASATTLYGDAVAPRRAWMDGDEDPLIAHELAHQWFGDLVTCRDWSEIWLNESFATYFEALWQEHTGGADAITETLENGAGWYFGQEKEYSRPIVCPVYAHPDDIFDACAYPKGAWVLHMLRKTIGDDAWWKGIRLYLERHRGKSVATREFESAMEQAAGTRLDWFFDPWLRGCGHPEFRVTKSWDAATKELRVVVEQLQEPSSRRCGPLVTGRPVFRALVELEAVTTSSREGFYVDVRKPRQEFTFALDGPPLLVSFDPEETLLKSVEYARPLAELLYELRNGRRSVARARAAGALADLPGLGEDQKREVLEALHEALSEGTVHVAASAASALGRLGGAEPAKALLEGLMTGDVRVRAARYEALGGLLPNGDAEAFLKAAMDEDESPKCRSTAAQAYGKAGAGAFDALAAAAKRLERDERILPGVLSGLSTCGDPRAAELVAGFTSYGRHPRIRERAALCVADILERRGAGDRESALLGVLTSLLEDPSFRLRGKVVERLGDLGDARAISALEARIGRESDGRMVKDMRAAIRKISGASSK